jgi:hypothetical protein
MSAHFDAAQADCSARQVKPENSAYDCADAEEPSSSAVTLKMKSVCASAVVELEDAAAEADARPVAATDRDHACTS